MTLTVTITDQDVHRSLDLVFVVFLGGAASVVWAKARRRREDDLSSIDRFYRVYGAWFTIWKEWAILEEVSATTNLDDARVFSLLQRATAAEGELESLLVKVATERNLTASERRRLGQFRQGYQRLRESIEEGVPLRWRVQGEEEDGAGAYVSYKALAVEFALLVGGPGHWYSLRTWKRPSKSAAQQSLIEITSWQVAATVVRSSR